MAKRRVENQPEEIPENMTAEAEQLPPDRIDEAIVACRDWERAVIGGAWSAHALAIRAVLRLLIAIVFEVRALRGG